MELEFNIEEPDDAELERRFSSEAQVPRGIVKLRDRTAAQLGLRTPEGFSTLANNNPNAQKRFRKKAKQITRARNKRLANSRR